MAGERRYSAMVLVVRGDGMVRTDLRDGRTVYLTEDEFWAYRNEGRLPERELEVMPK
jgi:hypothetical protein